MGFVPHGDIRDKHAGRSEESIRALRAQMADKSRQFRAPVKFHATDYKALDRSLMPRRMPIVGYSGHLRNTTESHRCYGTSHWRPTVPPNRSAAAAAAFETARKRALDQHKPGSYKHPEDQRTAAHHDVEPSLFSA